MVNNCLRQPTKAAAAYDDPPLPEDFEDEDTFSEGTVQAAKASDRDERPMRKATIRRVSSPVDSDTSDFSADERMQKADIRSNITTSIKDKKANVDMDTKAATKTTKRRKLTESTGAFNATPKLAPGSHLKDKFGMTVKKTSKLKYGKRPTTSSQSNQPGSWQRRRKTAILGH